MPLSKLAAHLNVMLVSVSTPKSDSMAGPFHLPTKYKTGPTTDLGSAMKQYLCFFDSFRDCRCEHRVSVSFTGLAHYRECLANVRGGVGRGPLRQPSSIERRVKPLALMPSFSAWLKLPSTTALPEVVVLADRTTLSTRAGSSPIWMLAPLSRAVRLPQTIRWHAVGGICLTGALRRSKQAC